LLTAVPALGQSLPSRIRGYKLYRTDVSVLGPADKTTPKAGNSASVKLGEFRSISLGLFSATVEVGAEIFSTAHSGKIEFLMFRDFTVGGIPVDIEEYDHPFSFTKNTPILLPHPFRISLSFADLPTAAYGEVIKSRSELPVKGTVLVFGRFRKMGFEFKRVIPVPISIKIRNPLHP
jgi:hypothetical protein